jgi:hypothetical protein
MSIYGMTSLMEELLVPVSEIYAAASDEVIGGCWTWPGLSRV